MVIAIFILVRSTLYNTYSQHHNMKKNIAIFLMFIGNSLLLLTILIMTFQEDDEDTEYLNECFLYASNVTENHLCRIQYCGTQILYPLLIYCAIIDFANIWKQEKNQKYMTNRLIWFSLALLISSACTLANMIGNREIYQEHILANTSYYTCTLGYCLVLFVSTLSIVIQANYFKKNWKTERSATRILGYMTLMAVLLIQSRTFADLFVYI